MSNVQVHCEHCDKSLYRIGTGTSTSASAVASVVLYDREYAGFSSPPGALEFCDWLCVSRWAALKAAELGLYTEKGEVPG